MLIIGDRPDRRRHGTPWSSSYRQLMAMTRAVFRDAATMVRRMGQRLRTAARGADRPDRAQTTAADAAARRTGARPDARATPRGDTHVADKVLSVFEPHTEAIRKGKIAKPTEFGKLVTIQEAEHQIITGYEVHASRPADMTLWTPALDRHRRRSSVGRRIWPPGIADSVRRPRTRRARPRRPPRDLAAARARKRRRGGRTNANAGSVVDNAGVSAAKAGSVCSSDDMDSERCRYHGLDGMNRWVGLGVIADNLVNTATFLNARATA